MTPPATADDSARLTQALDDLFTPLHDGDGPGLVVGIALRGRVIYRRGLGLASVQHRVANQPATRMRIASISKHFTALAALLLAEDGLLDLDAPVSRYLPSLPELDGYPTLRDFMQHTSGYRCTLDMGTLSNGLAAQPPGWQLTAMTKQTSTNFAPGHGQMYANGTYAALSVIIERVSGMPFADFLRTRVFEPLGMTDTEAVQDDTRMVPGMASSHVPAPGGGWRRGPVDAELLGDGNLVSTVDDMLRWMAHLNGPKAIGSEAVWRQLLTPAKLANGSTSTYALGLKRHAYRGVDVIHHSGGLFGLNAQMVTVPNQGLDIIIMVNGAPVSAVETGWKVIDAVIGDAVLGDPPRQARSADFPHLLGVRYQGRAGLLVEFADVAGRLGLTLMNMDRSPLLTDTGDALRIGFEQIGLGPYVWAKPDLAPDADGNAPGLLRSEISGDVEFLERLPSSPPDIAQLAQALLGRYRCDDLDTDAEIVSLDSAVQLLLRGGYSATRALSLEPLSSIAFSAVEVDAPWDRYVLSIERPNVAAASFWIDTLRARRVQFRRVPDVSKESP